MQQVRFQLEQTREGLQRQLAGTDGQMHVLQARLEDSNAEQQVGIWQIPLHALVSSICHAALDDTSGLVTLNISFAIHGHLGPPVGVSCLELVYVNWQIIQQTDWLVCIDRIEIRYSSTLLGSRPVKHVSANSIACTHACHTCTLIWHPAYLQ